MADEEREAGKRLAESIRKFVVALEPMAAKDVEIARLEAARAAEVLERHLAQGHLREARGRIAELERSVTSWQKVADERCEFLRANTVRIAELEKQLAERDVAQDERVLELVSREGERGKFVEVFKEPNGSALLRFHAHVPNPDWVLGTQSRRAKDALNTLCVWLNNGHTAPPEDVDDE
jgi:hypothetical protein